MTAHVVNRP